MQRRLIVMRHAKSAWDTDSPTDHARPLNARGRRDAPRVARELAGRGWVPELVLASDSMRTQETWEHMEAAFDHAIPVVYTPKLYHAGLGALQKAVSQVDPALQTLMVLGHNPGFEQALAWLSGDNALLTTGNAALLQGGEEPWSEEVTRPGAWTLVDVIRPKEL